MGTDWQHYLLAVAVGMPGPAFGDRSGEEGLFAGAARLVEAFSEAAIGIDWDGCIRLCNAAAARLLDVDPERLVGRPLLELIPERLRPAHREAFAHFVATGAGRLVGAGPARLPALRTDGTETEVELCLTALGPPGVGGLAALAVLVPVEEPADLSSHPVLARFLQAIVDASVDGVLAVSRDRRVIAVNRRFHDLWNLPPGSVRPGERSPSLGELQRSQMVDPDTFERAIAWGHEHPHQGQTVEVELLDGRVIEGYSAPIVDAQGTYLGRVWHLHDETKRRAEQHRLEQLMEQLRAAEQAQRFLLDASEVLAAASGLKETLESLARVAVPTLADLCLIDVTDDRGGIERMAAVHADPAQAELAARLRSYPPDPAGSHPSAEVMRLGRSSWSATMSDEYLSATTRDAEHLAVLQALRFGSYMAVPLVADGQVIGCVTLISAGSGRTFGPGDLTIAEDLAGRVALVVAKERRYERERHTSHTLQSSLLPSHLPAFAGVELAVRYLPGTRDTEVGGDFWDVALLRSGEVAIAVGDVAGHDMTAAATMAQLRSACRALRAHTSGPAELISLVQDTWDQLDLERIATAVFARLQPETGLLRVASAGHPAPVVIEPGRVDFAPVVPSPPFGAPPAPPASWEVTVPPGTTLVFFTDGLVEDRGRSLDDGLDRLLVAARGAPSLEADVLADHLLAAMSGAARDDDVALLVMRRTD